MAKTKEKKVYTESELRFAVREARRSGEREGRLRSNEHYERRKKMLADYKEIDDALAAEVNKTREGLLRRGTVWTDSKIVFSAAVCMIYRIKKQQGLI